MSLSSGECLHSPEVCPICYRNYCTSCGAYIYLLSKATATYFSNGERLVIPPGVELEHFHEDH